MSTPCPTNLGSQIPRLGACSSSSYLHDNVQSDPRDSQSGSRDTLTAAPPPPDSLAYADRMHGPSSSPSRPPSSPSGCTFTCLSGSPRTWAILLRSPSPAMVRRSMPPAWRTGLSGCHAVPQPRGWSLDVGCLRHEAISEPGSRSLICTCRSTLSCTRGSSGTSRQLSGACQGCRSSVSWYSGIRKSAAGRRLHRRQTSPSCSKSASAADACSRASNVDMLTPDFPFRTGSGRGRVCGRTRFSGLYFVQLLSSKSAATLSCQLYPPKDDGGTYYGTGIE